MPLNSAFCHDSRLSPKFYLPGSFLFLVVCWFPLNKISNNHNISSFYVFALLVVYCTTTSTSQDDVASMRMIVNVWVLKDLKGSSRGVYEVIYWLITSKMKYYFKSILDLQNTVWSSHSVFGLHLDMGPWTRVLKNYRSFTLLRNSWLFFRIQKFITKSRIDRLWFYKLAHESNPYNSPLYCYPTIYTWLTNTNTCTSHSTIY